MPGMSLESTCAKWMLSSSESSSNKAAFRYCPSSKTSPSSSLSSASQHCPSFKIFHLTPVAEDDDEDDSTADYAQEAGLEWKDNKAKERAEVMQMTGMTDLDTGTAFGLRAQLKTGIAPSGKRGPKRQDIFEASFKRRPAQEIDPGIDPEIEIPLKRTCTTQSMASLATVSKIGMSAPPSPVLGMDRQYCLMTGANNEPKIITHVKSDSVRLKHMPLPRDEGLGRRLTTKIIDALPMKLASKLPVKLHRSYSPQIVSNSKLAEMESDPKYLAKTFLGHKSMDKHRNSLTRETKSCSHLDKGKEPEIVAKSQLYQPGGSPRSYWTEDQLAEQAEIDRVIEAEQEAAAVRNALRQIEEQMRQQINGCSPSSSSKNASDGFNELNFLDPVNETLPPVERPVLQETQRSTQVEGAPGKDNVPKLNNVDQERTKMESLLEENENAVVYGIYGMRPMRSSLLQPETLPEQQQQQRILASLPSPAPSPASSTSFTSSLLVSPSAISLLSLSPVPTSPALASTSPFTTEPDSIHQPVRDSNPTDTDTDSASNCDSRRKDSGIAGVSA